MAKRDFVFTSESVSEGHPDKICDRISDAIVDTYLAVEPQARCGVETLVTTNRVVLAGEVRGPASITGEQLIEVARQAIRDIGYEQDNFHWERAAIKCHIHSQSANIAQGVDASGNKDEGAGDQGMMFGFACTETPAADAGADLLCARDAAGAVGGAARRQDAAARPRLRKARSPCNTKTASRCAPTKVVVSIQHSDRIDQDEVREIIRPYVVATLPAGWMCDEENFLVNPTGLFVIGGPDGDAGVTGRKIIVDTYGGAAPHGGGAFSGKDPTKVDRSAAYAARYLAKNVVGAGLAERCTIQVAYAIGVAKPLSFYVDTEGAVDEQKLARVLQELMDLSPRGIRTHLGLNRPIYTRTSAYGHFGRVPDPDGGFSWERLDLVDELRRAF